MTESQGYLETPSPVPAASASAPTDGTPLDVNAERWRVLRENDADVVWLRRHAECERERDRPFTAGRFASIAQRLESLLEPSDGEVDAAIRMVVDGAEQHNGVTRKALEAVAALGAALRAERERTERYEKALTESRGAFNDLMALARSASLIPFMALHPATPSEARGDQSARRRLRICACDHDEGLHQPMHGDGAPGYLGFCKVVACDCERFRAAPTGEGTRDG